MLDQLDHRVLIILRDGRHLVGILRSFDQFLNLVVEEAVERVVHGGSYSIILWIKVLKCFVGKYADIPLGLHVVRGDSIVLLGEVDGNKEMSDLRLSKITPEELSELPDVMEDKALWDFE